MYQKCSNQNVCSLAFLFGCDLVFSAVFLMCQLDKEKINVAICCMKIVLKARKERIKVHGAK